MEYQDIAICEDAQYEDFEFIREVSSPWKDITDIKTTRSATAKSVTTIARAKSELPDYNRATTVVVDSTGESPTLPKIAETEEQKPDAEDLLKAASLEASP